MPFAYPRVVDLLSLNRWFADNRRDLPWREPGTTPWGVLVSEIMLQQTPVARVEPVWREWIVRWPTPAHLAASSVADAVRHWGTLGYPRRARNLHRQAVIITQDHGGEVPRDVASLQGLPGIGQYTARAVAAFAFGDRHPVADTNVTRVIARVTEGAAFAGHWSAKDALTRVDSLLHSQSDAHYPVTNLAIMELGALVCRARSPLCSQCPLAAQCLWRQTGFPVDESVVPKKQARFDGSDRQARGRLLAVLRDIHEPVGQSDLLATHQPISQARRALDTLIADGLVVEVEQGDEPHYALNNEPG
jgi:A/G-specific adenine glycosylase